MQNFYSLFYNVKELNEILLLLENEFDETEIAKICMGNPAHIEWSNIFNAMSDLLSPYGGLDVDHINLTLNTFEKYVANGTYYFQLQDTFKYFGKNIQIIMTEKLFVKVWNFIEMYTERDERRKILKFEFKLNTIILHEALCAKSIEIYEFTINIYVNHFNPHEMRELITNYFKMLEFNGPFFITDLPQNIKERFTEYVIELFEIERSYLLKCELIYIIINDNIQNVVRRSNLMRECMIF